MHFKQFDSQLYFKVNGMIILKCYLPVNCTGISLRSFPQAIGVERDNAVYYVAL